jgi:ribosomal protein L1
VKIGRTSQNAKDLAENVEVALAHTLGFVTYHDEIKFSNIQSVSIKVGESPELPVFN